MDKLKVSLQYILPKKLLSRLVGKFAAAECGIMTQLFIKWFIRNYRIDMSEAAESQPAAYNTFNAFFTRALRAGVRPLCNMPNSLVHPVDGAVSQCGDIKDGQLFQAKGHTYSAATLLGGDLALANRFAEGTFATIYLAPKDYHRIHMPITGTLSKMIYVPGDLFSVNPNTAANVPGLFARNERVVALFETAIGPMAMVLVGATIVASIETIWAGTVTPPSGNQIFTWDYQHDDKPIILEKGEEMGRFKLGSTVVMLFGKDAITLAENVSAEMPTKMGELFGSYQ